MTTATGPDYITIHWRSAYTYSLPIQMLQVISTPECPTGVVEARTLMHNITNAEMNSMMLRNLGIGDDDVDCMARPQHLRSMQPATVYCVL